MSLALGDIVRSEGKYGIIIATDIQQAWGAKRFKIMFANGTVQYVWNKHMKKIGDASENP